VAIRADCGDDRNLAVEDLYQRLTHVPAALETERADPQGDGI